MNSSWHSTVNSRALWHTTVISANATLMLRLLECLQAVFSSRCPWWFLWYALFPMECAHRHSQRYLYSGIPSLLSCDPSRGSWKLTLWRTKLSRCVCCCCCFSQEPELSWRQWINHYCKRRSCHYCKFVVLVVPHFWKLHLRTVLLSIII